MLMASPPILYNYEALAPFDSSQRLWGANHGDCNQPSLHQCPPPKISSASYAPASHLTEIGLFATVFCQTLTSDISSHCQPSRVTDTCIRRSLCIQLTSVVSLIDIVTMVQRSTYTLWHALQYENFVTGRFAPTRPLCGRNVV